MIGGLVLKKTKADQLEKAKKLLKLAASYMCSDDPEQGDYCRCGAYVGAGESHKPRCAYISIQRFLNKGE